MLGNAAAAAGAYPRPPSEPSDEGPERSAASVLSPPPTQREPCGRRRHRRAAVSLGDGLTETVERGRLSASRRATARTAAAEIGLLGWLVHVEERVATGEAADDCQEELHLGRGGGGAG